MPSYSPVFSQAFIEYTSATPNAEFAVPTGFTAVVRQISGWQDIGGWTLQTTIQNSEAAPAVVINFVAADGALNYASAEGRWVCPGGGIIAISASSLGDTPTFYVGGYLLRNTLT